MTPAPRAPRAGSRQVAAALLGLLAAGACGGDATGPSGDWKPGTASYSLSVGDLTRTFLVHVPTHRPTTTTGALRPYPLLVLLHGSNGEGANVEYASRMDSIADVHGYVVAYPNALRAGGGLYPADWNAGTCCGEPQREGVDDLGFIAAIVTDAEKQLPVDPHRVYVAGFSSGALMAYHAGCQLAGTFAAIGVVEGSIDDAACAPRRAVPLVAVQGTADESVTYHDPSLTPPPYPVPAAATSLPPSVQFWVAANGCAAARDTATAPHVRQTSFTKCTGADVTLYTIDGGQHGWPGEPPDGLGSQEPMVELNFSRAMINFFDRHRQP